jgi:hypothetical protein
LRLGTLVAATAGAATILPGVANAATGNETQPTGYVPLSEKGAASGVATLDGGSKLPTAQLPDLLTGKKTFDASGKLEFNGAGFTPNYDTVLWVAGAPRVDPTQSSQGLYIQHRVAGDLHGVVNDAGASELRLDNASNTGTGQAAHENSLVVTGGVNDIGKLSGCLANFHTSGIPTGSAEEVALVRATQIPPLATGFTVGTAISVYADKQTAGATNWTVWAPEGNSCIGPLVARNAATPSLLARAIVSQSASVFAVQNSAPTTLFRVDPNGTGGFGGVVPGVTFFVNNNLATAGTVPMAIRGCSGQAADLQRWQDSTGSTLAKVTAAGAIKARVVTSSSRPSASVAGVGAQIYDSTLRKPLWSDGSVWRDAMGKAA